MNDYASASWSKNITKFQEPLKFWKDILKYLKLFSKVLLNIEIFVQLLITIEWCNNQNY